MSDSSPSISSDATRDSEELAALRALLPKDKMDDESVVKLQAAGFPKLLPVLPELLEWTADANWPIAGPIADLLLTSGGALVPHVQSVMEGQDDGWQWCCIGYFLARWPVELIRPFESQLRRLAARRAAEDSEGLGEVSRFAVARLDGLLAAARRPLVSFKHADRLHGPATFKAIYDAGTRETAGPLMGVAVASSQSTIRIGISVPKRVGNAVRRNRVKRLVRESFRLSRDRRAGSFDLVIVVRPHEDKPLEDYRRWIERLLERFGKRTLPKPPPPAPRPERRGRGGDAAGPTKTHS